MAKKWSVKDIKDKLDDDILDLSLCDIDEVPVKEITQVKRFSHLDLSNNALITLPKKFATLTQIVKLDLSKNMLTEIPENIGELKMLRHLDLYSNQISRLPLSFGDLKNLKWLDLKENPLTPAVATIAGPCSNASECQACAKNIVLYLRNVKVTIQEEKKRRLTAVQEIEKNNKKESKKKKKAEKKAAEKVFSAKKDAEDKSNGPKSLEGKVIEDCLTKNRNSNGASFLCNIFKGVIQGFLLFAFLLIATLVVFSFYDEHSVDSVYKMIENITGLPLKHYHNEGIKLLKIFNNQTRNYVEKTYQKYYPEDTSQRKKF